MALFKKIKDNFIPDIKYIKIISSFREQNGVTVM